MNTSITCICDNSHQLDVPEMSQQLTSKTFIAPLEFSMEANPTTTQNQTSIRGGWRIVWIALGLVCILCATCIVGCVGVYWVASSSVKNMIVTLMEESAQRAFQEEPQIQDNIGDIQSCRIDEKTLNTNSSRAQTVTFILEGPKGSGKATALIPKQTSSNGAIVTFPKTLTMQDGTTFDLTE